MANNSFLVFNSTVIIKILSLFFEIVKIVNNDVFNSAYKVTSFHSQLNFCHNYFVIEDNFSLFGKIHDCYN